MVSVQGQRFIKQRYTKYYYEELIRLRNHTDEFKLQEDRLNEFYKFITKRSKYYQQKLPNNLNYIKIDNLKNFPILEKEEIRENIDDIVTKDAKT